MSGEKTTYVRVPDYELANLRRQTQELGRIRNDLPGILSSIGQNLQKDFNSRMDELNRRARSYENVVNGLTSDLKSLERGVSDRLNRQRADFQKQVSDMQSQHQADLKNLEREVDRVFQEQNRKFTGMIADERRERQRHIENLQTQINGLVADKARKRKLAGDFVEDVRRIAAEIGNRYDHRRFAPGELDQITDTDLSTSISNHAHDMPEAALAKAQDAYIKLTELRIKLERAHQEYEMHRIQAIQTASALLKEVENNRIIRLPQHDQAFDLNFWSRGASGGYEKELAAILDNVNKGNLNLDEIKKVCGDLQTREPQFIRILEDASMRIISSQHRAELAVKIADVLERQGYGVVQGVYEGEDFRKGYYLKLGMADGTEIVASVIPEEEKDLENKLVIDSFDPAHVGEEVRLRRAQDICDNLRSGGVEVSAPQTTSHLPNKAVRDLEQVRKRKTAEEKA